MARKMHEKRPEEDNRYHDTWKLLKKYRDVTWSLEVSVRQVKNQFRIDYDCSIEDFLDSIYMAGADLGGTIIEDHAKCIERSYKMLTLLENAVNLLRTRHKNGEVYYWILYYSFLSPQKLKNVDEIIEVLRPHIRDISSSTYYRLRKEAVIALSSVLWGFSSQDISVFNIVLLIGACIPFCVQLCYRPVPDNPRTAGALIRKDSYRNSVDTIWVHRPANIANLS